MCIIQSKCMSRHSLIKHRGWPRAVRLVFALQNISCRLKKGGMLLYPQFRDTESCVLLSASAYKDAPAHGDATFWCALAALWYSATAASRSSFSHYCSLPAGSMGAKYSAFGLRLRPRLFLHCHTRMVLILQRPFFLRLLSLATSPALGILQYVMFLHSPLLCLLHTRGTVHLQWPRTAREHAHP